MYPLWSQLQSSHAKSRVRVYVVNIGNVLLICLTVTITSAYRPIRIPVTSDPCKFGPNKFGNSDC